MTLEEFVSKYRGRKVDFDGVYGAQCVDLFRFYNLEVLQINQPKGVAGAKDFWTNYDADQNLKTNFVKIPNTPEFVPKAGDVMIWGSQYGQWGHVAIVGGKAADIRCFEAFGQNDPLGTACQIKQYNYRGVLGVLRPKKLQQVCCQCGAKL